MTGMLLITRGLPASGKTSWAREQADNRPEPVFRLNRDDIRAMALHPSYTTPKFEDEVRVSLVQHTPIPPLLRAGVTVIVDDTNLRAKHVRNLAALAEQAGARWECVDHFLEVPLEECIRRDAARERSVGESVIRDMHQRFLSGGRRLPVPVFDAPVTGRLYEPLPGTPAAALVDIDGTVALMNGRSPYDPTRYHEDTPNRGVVDAVRGEWLAGMRIVFCSGRDETYRDVTERWIEQHVLPRGRARWELFMRPAGDTRNDALVKLELFDKHIRDQYTVLRVYDDRDRVVEAWRSLGLTVFQVAPGRF